MKYKTTSPTMTTVRRAASASSRSAPAARRSTSSSAERTTARCAWSSSACWSSPWTPTVTTGSSSA